MYMWPVQLGTLHMSKSIIRVIDASRGFEEFPMRDQVRPRCTVIWIRGRALGAPIEPHSASEHQSKHQGKRTRALVMTCDL